LKNGKAMKRELFWNYFTDSTIFVCLFSEVIKDKRYSVFYESCHKLKF
jgi:hypothetical protein